MEQDQARIRIDLTNEQTDLIKQASGKVVSALEFTAQELEERIAPTSLNFAAIKPTYTTQQ